MKQRRIGSMREPEHLSKDGLEDEKSDGHFFVSVGKGEELTGTRLPVRAVLLNDPGDFSFEEEPIDGMATGEIHALQNRIALILKNDKIIEKPRKNLYFSKISE